MRGSVIRYGRGARWDRYGPISREGRKALAYSHAAALRRKQDGRPPPRPEVDLFGLLVTDPMKLTIEQLRLLGWGTG